MWSFNDFSFSESDEITFKVQDHLAAITLFAFRAINYISSLITLFMQIKTIFVP